MSFLTRIYFFIRLVLLITWDLFVSVIDVGRTVINPKRVKESAIIGIPLDLKSAHSITVFANVITLTPGTLTLHVCNDRSLFYVHVMNASAEFVPDAKLFETKVRRVFGP